MLPPDQVRTCLEMNRGSFFDIVNGALVPINPKEGQWFCEFEIVVDYEGDEAVLAGAIVEYLGKVEFTMFDEEGSLPFRRPSVCEEGGEERAPRGDILILQG